MSPQLLHQKPKITTNIYQTPKVDRLASTKLSFQLQLSTNQSSRKSSTQLTDSGDFKAVIAKKQEQERSTRKTQPRCISSHVISRWYRPPEVIMVEPSYDTSADMWSLGCILAEMLHCTYKDRVIKERFMFAGTSSFPLSPC